jgi:hypothetical protein
MKVTMILADAAQVQSGKLYILGGGWSITGPNPSPSALAVKIEVPWHEANTKHRLSLALQDADGHPFRVPTPQGEAPLVIGGEFEVGRPAGLKPGTPLDAAIAIGIPPLPLAPDSRYVWRLTIDDTSDEGWQVTFTTRAARPQAERRSS